MASAEDLARQLPAYLAKADAQAIAQALDDFLANGCRAFYLDGYDDETLQGDGWRGVRAVRDSGDNPTVEYISALVLTNSCDIDRANEEPLPKHLTFAPIVGIANYRDTLRRDGIAANAIEAKIQAIRRQSVHGIFYLPVGGALDEECFAWFGPAQSCALDRVMHGSDSGKLFTLSQVGFYLLLFKLSVHFCRFTEGVDRTNADIEEVKIEEA